MRIALGAAAVIASLQLLSAQAIKTSIGFRAADPVMVDEDTAADAGGFQKHELSQAFDLVDNEFGSPGDATPVHAANVNTLDEVPDSSWFTNRIGVRAMPISEILRGANRFDPREAREWTAWKIVGGKGPLGVQPGFRAERAGDPGHVYQLEVDPKDHPRLATGAELVGSLIYHALGYNVDDFYLIKVDPRDLTIADEATIRDASGERKFTKQDLRRILRVAATDEDGRVYMSASRSAGEDMGHFEYHGTRSDDPNDIYPHEHRRELRANRVFAAWLAHDDSRAINTRNVRVKTDGRTYIRHYVRDFGAIMGSSTRFPDPALVNHEYYFDRRASLRQLFTLGLYTPEPARVRRPPHLPPSAGWFESESFDPDAWKPNYPNRAFLNMQADDAFWGARLVSRFSDEMIRSIVEAAGYDDPAAVDALTNTLIRRRDIVARVWLNRVNPIVDVRLSPDGALAFTNAAVAANVATHGTYTIAWSRFDNDSGSSDEVAVERQTAPGGRAPAALLASASYIEAKIWSEHPDRPLWAQPVRVYFRRDGAQWTTVGLDRNVKGSGTLTR